MRHILEKTLEYGISTFNLFIDFKAAYDTINREKLFEAMKEFKIPQKLMGLARATLKHVKYRVKL
jgi:sorting nexin-29